MIEPSVGRNLWYIPHQDEGGIVNGQPHAAFIAHVHDARLINVLCLSEAGSPYAKQNVRLLQDDEPTPPEGGVAVWMTFQKGQAAKTEAAESGQLSKQVADLALDVDAKFKSLGDWLTPKLAEIDLKLANPIQVIQHPADTPAPDAGAGQQAAT